MYDCTLLYLSGHSPSMIWYFFAGLQQQQQSIWWFAVLILHYTLCFADRYCPIYIYVYIFIYITFELQMLIIYFLDIPQE